jgi:beta-galactosidase/beta-glucuronidase
MSIHRIHLKGPWDYEWVGDPLSDAAESGRVTMPADWASLFGPAGGRARFRRRFHSPTNLEPEDRVWLVFDGVGGHGTVVLNDEIIGRLRSSDEPQRLDVATRLRPFNAVLVELEFDPAVAANAGGLYAPIAIEIESDHEW